MAELRREHLTPENVERIEVYLRTQGVELRSPEERAASLRQILARVSAGEDVWLFGYGSLMWNPACEVAESRPVRLHGFHRRFSLWNTFGRGTPERPGLMLALEPGGSCAGIGLRIAADKVESELGAVWAREMTTSSYVARWVRVRSANGAMDAITFVVNPASARYAGRLSREETARLVAQGAGPFGTSRAYLEGVVQRLAQLGLRDRAMGELLREVERL